MSLTRRRHDDVGAPAERLQLLGRRVTVAGGHRRVHAQAAGVAAVAVEHHRDRHAHVLRSADHHRVATERLHLVSDTKETSSKMTKASRG